MAGKKRCEDVMSNTIDILKIYFHIKNKLENSPEVKGFLYHSWVHTKSVYDAVFYLGRLENVDDEDFEELKIASLYHDIGYTTGKAEFHECESVSIALKELPSFGICDQRISNICRLILSTIPEARPAGLLEEIMHDADLEYLGRDYYPYVAELLRREKSILHKTWKDEQLSFLYRHKFFTTSAQNLFDDQKEKNIRKLEDQIRQDNEEIHIRQERD